MIALLENQFSKRTAWSLLYFLIYAYLNILAQSQIWCTTLYIEKIKMPIEKNNWDVET
jgi:hypothetical protein